MRNLAALTLLAILAGCSSAPTREDIAKDTARADAVRQSAEAARAAQRFQQAQAELAAVPPWVLDIPKPDARGVYALGAARSSDSLLVTKKAMLDAQYGLAKQIQQEISGSETSVVGETNARTGTENYRAVINSLVARVPIAGSEVIRNEVKVLPNGQYGAFVLLLVPYDQINKTLALQRSETNEEVTKAALDDLERRVNARQQARIRDAEAAQRLRLAELTQRSTLINAQAQPITEAPQSSAAAASSAQSPASTASAAK